jgi:hypothetical protein
MNNLHKPSPAACSEIIHEVRHLLHDTGPMFCAAALVNFALVLDGIRNGSFESPPASIDAHEILKNVLVYTNEAMQAESAGRTAQDPRAALAVGLVKLAALQGPCGTDIPHVAPTGASAAADAETAAFLARMRAPTKG